MTRSAPPAKPLGATRAPRRRFVAPTAVRLAQACLAVRVGLVAGLLLAAGTTAPVTSLVVPGAQPVRLPGGGLWSALAGWVLLGSIFETVLVMRLSTLRTGSRRVILLVESAVIAGTGMYAAAGLKAALIPMTASIAAVILLRLDHVRHSFNVARAERRLVGRRIPTTLFSGYALDDPRRPKAPQEVTYRLGDGWAAGDPSDPGRSRA